MSKEDQPVEDPHGEQQPVVRGQINQLKGDDQPSSEGSGASPPPQQYRQDTVDRLEENNAEAKRMADKKES